MFNSIFSAIRARTTDPETSHLAAEQIEPAAKTHKIKILKALEENGPMGKDQIAVAANMPPSQVWRRLNELQKSGLIKLTGKTVKSLSGREEREWTV
jgi:predicted transcriptional regulator